MVMHHLREFTALSRHGVNRGEVRLGTLSGLVIDTRDWFVREFVVAGRSASDDTVLVPVEAFVSLDDERGEILVDSSTDVLRSSPYRAAGGALDEHQVNVAPLIGRTVDGLDGRAGRIADLLVNINVWKMRYFLIDTGSGSVLTDIEWADTLGDATTSPTLDLPAVSVTSAPPYPGLEEMCTGYEEVVYRHYTSRNRAQGRGGA